MAISIVFIVAFLLIVLVAYLIYDDEKRGKEERRRREEEERKQREEEERKQREEEERKKREEERRRLLYETKLNKIRTASEIKFLSTVSYKTGGTNLVTHDETYTVHIVHTVQLIFEDGSRELMTIDGGSEFEYEMGLKKIV